VNVVVGANFTTVAQLAALGVRRISVGGSFARLAYSAFLAAAAEISEHGTFGAFEGGRPGPDINRLFK
jgi:methylisocitrate lyase